MTSRTSAADLFRLPDAKYNKVEAILSITYSFWCSMISHAQRQVSEISKQLKQLARELWMYLLSVQHNCVECRGQKPQLSDFSDSTQLERDADVAIMIYHIDKKEGDAQCETFLLIEKTGWQAGIFVRVALNTCFSERRRSTDTRKRIDVARYYLSLLTPSKWQFLYTVNENRGFMVRRVLF